MQSLSSFYLVDEDYPLPVSEERLFENPFTLAREGMKADREQHKLDSARRLAPFQKNYKDYSARYDEFPSELRQDPKWDRYRESTLALPTWQDRPDSACMLDKIRSQHKWKGVCILPAEAFEPTEAEKRASEKLQEEIHRRNRNEMAKARYRRNMDETREKWRKKAAADRADPVKGEALRKLNREWHKTKKGKEAEERHRPRRNRQKREKYANDPVYRAEQQARARERYHRKKREDEERRTLEDN